MTSTMKTVVFKYYGLEEKNVISKQVPSLFGFGMEPCTASHCFDSPITRASHGRPRLFVVPRLRSIALFGRRLSGGGCLVVRSPASRLVADDARWASRSIGGPDFISGWSMGLSMCRYALFWIALSDSIS